MKNKFIPTAKEELAFKKVIKAINEAKKLGLRFYGQQHMLTAFNAHAEKYMSNFSVENLMSKCGNGRIPNLSANVLSDSGADDEIYFNTSADNPENQ